MPSSPPTWSEINTLVSAIAVLTVNDDLGQDLLEDVAGPLLRRLSSMTAVILTDPNADRDAVTLDDVREAWGDPEIAVELVGDEEPLWWRVVGADGQALDGCGFADSEDLALRSAKRVAYGRSGEAK